MNILFWNRLGGGEQVIEGRWDMQIYNSSNLFSFSGSKSLFCLESAARDRSV